MTFLVRLPGATFLCLLLTLPAFSQTQPAPCAVPPGEASGRIFYVDPEHGNMANDGSEGAPWSTLHDVVAKGMIATERYDIAPYRPGAALRPANPEGPVHAGDTILLRTGDHGKVVLTGVNSAFITIAAAPGQKPVIDHLETYGASRWRFRGIEFRGKDGGWLVEFRRHAFWGPSDNIVFEGNVLHSEGDAAVWTPADWVAHGVNGIADSASCSRLRFNRLFNVRFGISCCGEHSLVEGNSIDNFGDDGIDFGASNLEIRDNYIANNHDIGDRNHNDGMQGFTFTDEGAENVMIADNVVINATTANLPFPGGMQGISIFDGKWRNVNIVNNTVLTNAWHGISLYGVQDSRIEGNAVLATDPKQTTWIKVADMKQAQGGRHPRNVVVRGNVATRFVLPDDDGQVIASRNLVAVDIP